MIEYKDARVQEYMGSTMIGMGTGTTTFKDSVMKNIGASNGMFVAVYPSIGGQGTANGRINGIRHLAGSGSRESGCTSDGIWKETE